MMADPAKRVLYEEFAKASGKPVFSMTVADFFNAPAVDEVDLSGYTGASGDAIVVRAHEDFEVIGVQVNITDANGQAIESGSAVESPAKSGRRVYTATAAVATGTNVRISVAASDRPGGKGEGAAEKTL
jgi:hypothetical protein